MDEEPLRIQLLGPIRVERNGVSIQVTSRRQRTLLAALALTPGRVVSTADLVDSLWGEDPPIGAATTLQTYVSRLRSTLGPDAIVHEHAGYRLAVDTSTDVGDVERLARGARLAAPHDPAAAAAAFAAALGCWQGGALFEVADDAWFVPEVVRLAELRSLLVDEWATAMLDAGRADEVVPDLESAVMAQPLREQTHLLLIRALHVTGRSAEAMRVANRFREVLADAGLEAGTNLLAIEQAVVSGSVIDGADGSRASVRLGTSSPSVRRFVFAGSGRFVGRTAERADLAQLLRTERLVSVVAAGGMGKSRLVAELVSELDGPDLAVVELAGTESDDVEAALAPALGVTAVEVDLGVVCDVLGDAELVIVLDNCEHVLDAVRHVVRTLLQRCPGVTVLVTSRSRLALPDEVVLSLAPLHVESDAVELFLDRLSRAARAAVVDPEERAAIVDICRAVGGAPLAIELAASRAATSGVDELYRRRDELLSFLSPAGVTDKRGSLVALVRWSFDLLSRPGRELLTVLSVVDGEFDRDAAERLARASLGETFAAHLDGLVDASLVSVTSLERRYRIADTVRSYCRDHGSPDLLDRARDAHVDWVSALVGAADVVGADEYSAWLRVTNHRDDVRSALRWGVARRRGEEVATITAAIGELFHYRPDPEVLAWIRSTSDLLLAEGGDRSADGLAAGARASWLMGDLDDAVVLAQRSLALRPERPPWTGIHALGVVHLYRGELDQAADWFGRAATGDAVPLAARLDAIAGEGLVQCYRGDLDQAEATAQLLRRMAVAVSSDTYLAFADYVAGEVAIARGDRHVEAGIGLLGEAVDRSLRRDLGFIAGIANVALASAVVRHRTLDESVALFPPLVQRWRRTATWTQLWTTLRLIAELLVQIGSHEVAALILAAADADPSAPRIAGDDLDRMRSLRGSIDAELGPDAVVAISTVASQLTRSQVVDRALMELTAPA